jgi:hypothetical protein
MYPARLAVRQALLDALLQDHRIRPETVEDIHHERILFREETEEEMLGADVLVVSALRIFPRFYKGAAYPAGEVVTAQVSLLVADLRFYRPVIIARRVNA